MHPLSQASLQLHHQMVLTHKQNTKVKPQLIPDQHTLTFPEGLTQNPYFLVCLLYEVTK